MAKSSSARPLVIGGIALAAAAAGALKNRERLTRLFGRAGDRPPAPLPSPSEAAVGQPSATTGAAPAPAIANVDAAGPPANTATSVPAPEPVVHEPAGGIDEAAEEAAAAAEAANIGGGAPEYPGRDLDELAGDADHAIIEAGGGEAEGQEVAEFELRDNAEPPAGDPLEGGRQIEDVIDAQDDPTAGEQLFDDQSSHGNPRAEAEQSAVGTADPLQDPEPGGVPNAPSGASRGGSRSRRGGASNQSDEDANAAAPDPDSAVAGLPEPPGGGSGGRGQEPDESDKPGGDEGSEWQTWSGRAVEP